MEIPKIIKSETVFDGYITVKRDTLEFPDGKTMTYDYIARIEAVAVLPILENSVILLRQYRHPLKRITYDLPGGGLEPGEEPETAAKRELEEETGYTTEALQYLGRYNHAPGCLNSVVYLYVTNKLIRGKTRCDSTELLSTLEIPIANFKKFITNKELEPIVPLSFLLAKERGFFKR